MRLIRVVLPALCLATLAFGCEPALASVGIAKWEAGTCTGGKVEVKSCAYTSPESFYTQAAGHPPWGLTGFELAHSGSGSSREPEGAPLKRIRVDVPPGLAADPQALPTCTRKEFEAKSCSAETEAGFVELEAVVTLPVVGNQILTLEGKVFNLQQEAGLPLLFGIEVNGVEPIVQNVQLYLEGHVSYASEGLPEAPSGNFHEWFVIDNIPSEVAVEPLGLPLTKAPLRTLKSKLFFNGHAGKGNFLTMPSNCKAPTTSYLEVETYAGERKTAPTTPPVSVEGCDKVPFKPTATVTPETSQYDTPDGTVTEVKVPQNEKSEEINTADIADAHVTLPEGLTLNPSAARGLEACTQAQLAKGRAVAVSCPAASKVATVNIETDLPPGSLTGNVYLGKPNGVTTITGPPYLIFIDAESVYGVSVRLEGKAEPNPVTGRLEVSFLGNPQLPFSDLALKLNGGPRAPLANPISCATLASDSVFTPYTEAAPFASSTPFAASGCPNPLPFSLAQSTADSSGAAGAHTNFTFDLARNDGQQYLSKVSTTLPGGLVGSIASVPLCAEPQAAAGTCSSASQIGTASVSVGSGSEPYPFTGPVYLTTGYGGAPYGLSVPVHAAAGPFDFGMVITRAGISIDPHTARVIVNAGLPTIVSGVPLRLRSVSVNVNRANFLLNPTNCGALATQSTLTSTFGAGDALSSPLQVSGCSALAFAPKFSVSTSAKASRLKGASLKVKLTQTAGQANLHEVHVELPKQLVARLSTLNQACTAAAFEANPASCPAASNVGTATASTPILPVSLSGPAYLVSHGNEAFPDLEVVLSGDGVTVVLDGQTKITGAVTSSTFSTIPDVPVSSFQLSLPTGSHSALSAVGNLCTKPLYMPTTIVAQSAKKVTQKTKISVAGCARIKILSHRVKGHRLILRVRVPGAGRLKASGTDLRSLTRKVRKAGVVTLKLGLSKRGLARLRQKGRLTIRAHVGFTAKRGVSAPTLSAKASFRR